MDTLYIHLYVHFIIFIGFRTNRDSRLCDCNQVQLCHRLDIPLRLILEPKERNVSHQSSESERQESFDPQALLQQDNQRVPNEEEIFITHSIFENAMEKVRSCISDAETTSVQTLLADVRCAISGLAQSVKAVLAMVCQSIAFPDVLDALGAVQMSVMDALKNISSADHTQAMKHCFSDGLMSSIRRHGKHSAPSIGFSTADEPSSLRLSQSKRDKVHCSLAKLESALFHQLSCFFDWLQAGVRINPNFLRPCMLKNLRSDSLPALRPRPKGVVLVADTLTESTGKAFNLAAATSLCNFFRFIIFFTSTPISLATRHLLTPSSVFLQQP
ncbi:unnamed protein product [Dicrocoelium dendriticum]|nr:unnamed protein product [Dicrocoelium dendriticum]